MAIKPEELDLFVQCARAQALPREILAQAGEDFVEFRGSDFANNGGWLGSNVWEAVDLGDAFRVQVGLSALVNPDGSARKANEEKNDSQLGMNFKFTRFVIPKESLDRVSLEALTLKAEAMSRGEKQPCWLHASKDALLQFDLQMLEVNVEGREETVLKVFGINVYLEGLSFRCKAGGMAQRREAGSKRTSAAPTVDLISEVYGGTVEGPVPVVEASVVPAEQELEGSLF